MAKMKTLKHIADFFIYATIFIVLLVGAAEIGTWLAFIFQKAAAPTLMVILV